MEKMDVSSSSIAPGSPSQGSSVHGDEVVESLAPGVDPEEDSSHYMAVLIESLSILGRVQDALDVSGEREREGGEGWAVRENGVRSFVCFQAIGRRMERELLLIIERASIQVQRV